MNKPHYIKQWRKHRGLTQERLAGRIELSQGHLSQLENYKREYNQRLLESIAEALSCTAADLIMRDPTQEDVIWSIWDRIPVTERPQVMRIIETFTGHKKAG